MKSTLLFIHLLAIGIWLGCVLTEALFERALLGQGRTQELLLAGLHKRVDVVVEIPAFLIVVATGVLMLSGAAPSGWLHLKIALGVLAVVANVGCVWIVFRRLHHAQANNWADFERLDHLQHKVGAVVLIGMLGAIFTGAYLLFR